MGLLHEAGSRGGQLSHAVVADLVVVHGVHDGLAGLDVLELAVLVEHGEQQAEALYGGDLVGGLEVGQVSCGHGVDGLHGGGGQGVGAGSRVGQNLPGHALSQGRARAVVVFVALENNLLAGGAIVGHLVGARTDGVEVEGLGVLLDGGLGNNLDDA